MADTNYERPIPRFGQQARGMKVEDEGGREGKVGRIKTWMAACLIIVALVLDIIETVITYTGVGAVVAEIIVPAASFGFWIWLHILGVSATGNMKRFWVSIAVPVIEIIPVFDAIPLLSFGWTLGMIATVVITRSEDKGGIIGKVADTASMIKK